MTEKKKSALVSYTVEEIKTIVKASHLLREYEFFDNEYYKEYGLKSYIDESCKNRLIDKEYVKKVCGPDLLMGVNV